MEETAVQPVAEETADTQSQGVEEQTTNESSESETDLSSSEDVNTQEPADDAEEDVVKSAEGEAKSAKGKGRVAELASRNKLQAARIAELEEASKRVSSAASQTTLEGKASVDPDTLTRADVQILKAELALDREKQTFAKLERKYPQMDPSSDEYDQDFDNTVYKLYRAGEDPEDAVRQIKKLMNLEASKAGLKLQENIAKKGTASAGTQQRTRVDTSSNSERDAKMAKYKQSGRVDDLVDLL